MQRPHIHRRLVGAVALGAVAALALTAAPNGAAARPAPRVSAFAPAGVHPNVGSTYQAGYQATEPGIWHASAQFYVPAVTGCTGTTTGVAFGIGNEQVEGAPTLYALAFVICNGGVASFQTQTLAGVDTEGGSASAGDLIAITVNQTLKNITVTLKNKTTGQTVKSTGTPTPDNSLMYGSLPLFAGPRLAVPDFGSVLMAKPYLENAQLSAWAPTKVNRSSHGTVEISTANFAPSGSFRLTYEAP